MTKRTKIILAIIIIIPHAALAGIMMPADWRPFWSRRFDSRIWREAGHFVGRDIRGRMVDDLLANYPLKGMSRQQVLDLLGQPERGDGINPMIYNLGREREFMRFDRDWLWLILDDEQRVVGVHRALDPKNARPG